MISLEQKENLLTPAWEKLKAGSVSFHFAALFLPPSSREPIALYYAWCREVDDAIDNSPLEDSKVYLQKALDWFSSEEQAPPFSSIGWKGFSALVDSEPLLKKYARDLLRGMERDLEFQGLKAESDLDSYCYEVAGSVGAALCVLSGIRDPKVISHAIAFGNSLQMVNITRDILEDQGRKRIYLPEEWIPDLAHWPKNSSTHRALIQKLLAKARKEYEWGCQGLKELPWGLSFAFGLAGEIYWLIGKEIQKNPELPFERRVSSSLGSKISTLISFGMGFFSQDLKGVLAGGLVMASLGVSLFWSIWLGAEKVGLGLGAALFLFHTFLFTGLFITSHDSMHGSLAPHFPRLNRWMGKAALFLYAGFSYRHLLESHGKHHSYVATEKDPDFARGNQNFFPWFFNFLWHYRSLRPFLFYQVISILVLVSGGDFLLYLLLWCVPALLSAAQLFYFGTYLPHHERPEGYNSMRAFSVDYPVWLSFLTCYHFGYHFEHHYSPGTPWWRLPSLRKSLLTEKLIK